MVTTNEFNVPSYLMKRLPYPLQEVFAAGRIGKVTKVCFTTRKGKLDKVHCYGEGAPDVANGIPFLRRERAAIIGINCSRHEHEDAMRELYKFLKSIKVPVEVCHLEPVNSKLNFGL